MANVNNVRTAYHSRATHGVYLMEDMAVSTGYRYYVDSGSSGAGDTQGHGSSPDAPFATLAYAVLAASGHLIADHGDIIYVMPGHTESVTAADDIMMDIAGVTVIGIGGIGDRPVITFDTGTGADIEIDAANITIKNISFRCNIGSLIAAIDVDAAHFWMKDCSFIGTDAANEAFLVTILGDANADDMIVESCDFNYLRTENATAITTQSTACIEFVGGDRTKVIDCHISGDFTVSAIYNRTTAAYDIQLLENHILNTATEEINGGIKLDSSTTGFIIENTVYAADPSSPNDVIDDGACVVGVNWVVNDIGEAPIIWGTADTESLAGKVDIIDEYHDVPTANTSDNDQINEVIGNKTDAATTGSVGNSNSLIAYNKQEIGALIVIDEYHDVPIANTSDNDQINEVIGNKTDIAATGAVSVSNSLIAYNKQEVGALIVIEEFHDVPAADTSDNDQINEVIGNKTDAATTGVVGNSYSNQGYLKQIITTGGSLHSDGANYLSVLADFTSATWQTINTHEIATVTGVVRMRIIPHVVASIGDADNSGTIELGVSNSSGGIIAATTCTGLDTGEIWWASTVASATALIDYANIVDFVVDGDDVGYEISATGTTAGSMRFEMWWEPVSDGAMVEAGDGSAL